MKQRLSAALKCGKHPSQAQAFEKKYGVKYWEVTNEAAKMMLDIYEPLMECVEARKLCVEGVYYQDSHRPDQANIKIQSDIRTFYMKDPTLCVFGANLIHLPNDKVNTAQFFATAANNISKIAERVK